jgi:hypothetical protein
MALPWGLVGPAFDYPTPYSVENRLLLLRGALLLALALALTLLVSFRPEADSSAAAALLGTEARLGDPIPLSLAAALFAVLGVVNIVRASGQKRLLLEPGQPASLTGEILREAQGASPGAAWLQRALVNGAPEPLPLDGPYTTTLRRLVPELGHWPRALHRHLARRLAHFFLALLMFVLLLPAWLLGTPVAAALAALGLGAIVVLVVGGSALAPQRPVPGPVALAVWTLLGALMVAAALLGAGRLPGQSWLALLVPLQLPWALAALLWGLWLVEGLALLAARAQVAAVPTGRVDPVEGTLTADVDATALFKELDLELHRHWAEGVPNRRHAWQPAVFDASLARGRVSARVLEESNPLLGAADRGRPRDWAHSTGPERWLWLLGALALVWTLMGAALWAWNGWFQLRDANVFWTKSGIGLALIVAAGHALRVSHLLWSRFEVDSTVLSLEFEADWARLPSTDRHTRDGEALGTVDLQSLQVRVAVAQARSVFFAAAEHRLGSRTLRGLVGDAAAARQWLERLQALAVSVSQAQPAAAEKRRQARESAQALRAAALAASATVPQVAAAAAPRPARYCAVCGTAVLAGARFCQHCGSALPPA